MALRMRKKTAIAGMLVLAVGLAVILHPALLAWIGRRLIAEDSKQKSDVAVVLNTGVEIYPRLMAAAALYRQGWVDGVCINGNRKSDTLRRLEALGLQPCCPWFENHLRILSLLGVPRSAVRIVDAPNAYDTISEAEAAGQHLLASGVKRILLVTSKYHTRRAGFIWKRRFGKKMGVRTVAAPDDPFDADHWWRDGRQIRWVLAEYGAWVYYGWRVLGEGKAAGVRTPSARQGGVDGPRPKA